MSIVKLEGVSFVYGKKSPYEIHALDNVDLAIEENLITGIIGHTGSGKSTLVQMFNGLIRPDSGRVTVDGEDIWAKPKQIGKVRFKVGMVMQYPEYQLFADTVIEDIGYGPRNMGLDEQEILACSKEAADMVGISEQMYERSPFDLSGGEKRRVAIAGILSMHPEILILDEPAAGLDPIGRKTVFEAIAKYNRETGATVILVSHSMEDLATYCDKVLVMHNGKVHRHGTVSEVFSVTSELPALGLDIPQVAHIAAMLKEKGIELQGNLYTVDGLEKAILDRLKGGDAV